MKLLNPAKIMSVGPYAELRVPIAGKNSDKALDRVKEEQLEDGFLTSILV